MEQERLARIEEMENICHRAFAALRGLESAAEDFRALERDIMRLETYYTSPLWLSDRDADQAGEVPRDMKRGILAEDTVWDLLTDIERVKALLRALC